VIMAYFRMSDWIATVDTRDRVTGNVKRSVQIKENLDVRNGIISPDGKSIAFATKSALRLYDTGTAKELARFPLNLQARLQAFAPDGRTIVLAGSDTVQ